MERTVDKIINIRDVLKSRYLERDEVIEGAVCALITGNHLLLIGPPGTAKSQLANELCGKINGARYFQWLLTKFTTPRGKHKIIAKVENPIWYRPNWWWLERGEDVPEGICNNA